MFKRTISAALVFGAAAIAPPVGHAQAMPACGTRDALTEVLTKRYDERLIGGGLQNPVSLFELWSSETTGSFTVLITRPDGTACIVASGSNWHDTPKPKPGEARG